MALLRSCNNCGHEQMIGYNPVDGRVQWWTSCESCGDGDFQALPDPKTMEVLRRAFARTRTVSPDGAAVHKPKVVR